MKCILLADIHAHNYSQFFKYEPSYGNNRLKTIVDALIKVTDSAIQHKISKVFILGDLFHIRGTISATVFKAVYDAIEYGHNEGINYYILAGNHDQANKLGTITSLTGLKNISKVIEVPTVIGNILCIPFLENVSETKEILQKYSGIDYIFGHLGVLGASVGLEEYMPSEQLQVEDFPLKTVKKVFLGHYHKHQYLDEKIMYLGSLVQRSFEDVGDKKGYWILDLESKEIVREYTEYPTFNVVSIKSISDYKKFNSLYKEKDFYKIKVNKHLSLDFSKFESVIISLEEEENNSMERIANISTKSSEDMIKTYVKYMKPKDENDIISKGLDIINTVRNTHDTV